MANAFVTIVAAELVASNDGLGKMLWDARLFMQIEDIFVALVSLGLLGFTDRPGVPLADPRLRRALQRRPM